MGSNPILAAIYQRKRRAGSMRPPELHDPADDAAWAEVLRRWGDDEAHRDYLARHPGLEGLAHAGGCSRRWCRSG